MARWYVSSAAWSAVAQFATSHAYTLGQYVRQLAAPSFGNERVFKVTTAGTSGGSEPAWNLGNNATTVSGTVTFTQVAGQEAEQAAANWKAPFANIQGWLNAINSTGDTIYLSSDHAESSAASLTYNFGVPTQIISVSRGVGSSMPPVAADVTTGASITTTVNQALTWTAAYAEGLTLQSGTSTGSGAPVIRPRGNNVVLKNCTVVHGGTGGGNIQIGAGDLGKVLFINTSLQFAATSDQVIVNGLGAFEWINSTAVVGSFAPTILFGGASSQSCYMRFRAVDFTASAGVTAIFPTTGSNLLTAQGPVEMEECGLPAAMTFARYNGMVNVAGTDWRFSITGNTAASVQAFAHVSDTGMSTHQWHATLNHPRRAGGATSASGITMSFAFQKDGNGANSFYRPYRGPLLPVPPVPSASVGVSKTVSLYLVSMSALDNAQAWIDVETLDGTGLVGSVHSTQNATLATPTALTADTSDWTANVSNRANTTAYALGQPIKLGSNPGLLFVCTTAGTSAGSEPAGYASAVDGGTVTDGTAVFQAAYRYVITVTFTPGRIQLARCRPHFAPTAALAGGVWQIIYDPQPTLT